MVPDGQPGLQVVKPGPAPSLASRRPIHGVLAGGLPTLLPAGEVESSMPFACSVHIFSDI